MELPEGPSRPPVGARLTVATPVFEGPLELLLALAEREQVPILEIPLATLTDGYVRAIAEMEQPDPREMAEFLWIAARLLLLKSVALLPDETEALEVTELVGWEEDVRRRLDEYRVYRQMAEDLMARAASDPYAFPPPGRPVEVMGQEEPLRMDALVIAFQSVLARIPPRPVVVSGRAWTLDDKLQAFDARLRHGPVELVEMLLECEDRLEAVVTFVALLELLRRGAVRIRQRESFGEVWVERR